LFLPVLKSLEEWHARCFTPDAEKDRARAGRNGFDNVLDRKYSTVIFVVYRWLPYAGGIFVMSLPGDSFWVYARRVPLNHPLSRNN
jgi:hypothetical protein